MKDTRRKPKKSDKIEVRISHEEKRALQVLARQRGQTVSTIVRGLVTDHLKTSLRAEHQPSIRDRTSMILHPFKSHPRKFAAALLATGGFAVALLPAAADPMTVALSGNIGKAGTDTARAFDSTVTVEPGVPVSVLINDPDSDVGDYRIEFTVTPDSRGRLVIDVNLFHGLSGGKSIANPRITTLPGQEARVLVSGGEDMEDFSFDARVQPD